MKAVKISPSGASSSFDYGGTFTELQERMEGLPCMRIASEDTAVVYDARIDVCDCTGASPFICGNVVIPFVSDVILVGIRRNPSADVLEIAPALADVPEYILANIDLK